LHPLDLYPPHTWWWWEAMNGELSSLPLAGMGVGEIYLPVVATGRMGALLQPVSATGKKCPKNPSLLVGAGDWLPH